MNATECPICAESMNQFVTHDGRKLSKNEFVAYAHEQLKKIEDDKARQLGYGPEDK